MIQGHVEADILRTVYQVADQYGFRVQQAHLQDPPDDECQMGGPWPHVVVFLWKPSWWRMRRPRERGHAFGCDLTRQLPGLRVSVSLID